MGSGPHLCFLHGFCEDSTIWNHLIYSLKENYTCIAIDLPGFGKSKQLSFTNIPEIAQSVNQLLEKENAQNCILFGHSMGGYIAADYLEKFAYQLHAVGFIHSTVLNDSDLKKKNRKKTIDFIKQHGTNDFFRLFIPGLVALRNRGRLREQLTQLVSSTPTTSIVNGLKAMMIRPSHVNTIAHFNKPVLFMKGEEDTHYSSEEIYQQASVCQTSQVSLLPDIGHLSMLEDQEKCLIEVSRFLAFVEAVT